VASDNVTARNSLPGSDLGKETKMEKTKCMAVKRKIKTVEGNKVTNEGRKETQKRVVKIMKETQKGAIIILRRKRRSMKGRAKLRIKTKKGKIT